jgi:hypothetical protein
MVRSPAGQFLGTICRKRKTVKNRKSCKFELTENSNDSAKSFLGSTPPRSTMKHIQFILRFGLACTTLTISCVAAVGQDQAGEPSDVPPIVQAAEESADSLPPILNSLKSGIDELPPIVQAIEPPDIEPPKIAQPARKVDVIAVPPIVQAADEGLAEQEIAEEMADRPPRFQPTVRSANRSKSEPKLPTTFCHPFVFHPKWKCLRLGPIRLLLNRSRPRQQGRRT